MAEDISINPTPPAGGHRRRIRYRGKHPRRFEEKYKEQNPDQYPETVAKVLSSGKTPAGSHRSILVAEILDVLKPAPGMVAVDCTVGHGGHTVQLLDKVMPGGRLVGLDADPLELPKTEIRLRTMGFGAEVLSLHRCHFAGLQRILASHDIAGADVLLADLGVSSMQLDDPARGFSMKQAGPLDMRMNPNHGQPVSSLLASIQPHALSALLAENADEPSAQLLGQALAGGHFESTTELVAAIKRACPNLPAEAMQQTIRRVFQALRIAVNDELSALDSLLRILPECLNPGGRAAILTFHSGEDRRVKRSFEDGLRKGFYSAISEVIRPSPEERRSNLRSAPAKLRWAQRSGQTHS